MILWFSIIQEVKLSEGQGLKTNSILLARYTSLVNSKFKFYFMFHDFKFDINT